MNIEEARAVYIAVGGFGLGVLLAALVAYFAVRNYFAPYLSEKAKNLATREDIAGLTREVEAVRAEFNLAMEESRARISCDSRASISGSKRTKKHLPSGVSCFGRCIHPM